MMFFVYCWLYHPEWTPTPYPGFVEVDRNQYQEPDLFCQMIWKMVLFQRSATQYVIPLLISSYGVLITLVFVMFQAFVIIAQRIE